MEGVEICTRVLESLDANTKLIVGAILTVLINVILIVRQIAVARVDNNKKL